MKSKEPLNTCVKFPQGMKICNPEGRDCIENKATSTFNCSVACEGIYADVQWVENVVEGMEEEPIEDELEKKILKILEKEMIKGGKNRDGLDRQKFKKLMSDYNQFKKNQVPHFRFDSAADSTSFGKY